jgi:ketosteroid isomerase-like protein
MAHTTYAKRNVSHLLFAAALVAITTLACDADSPRAAIAAEIRKGVTALKAEDIDAFLDQVADEVLPPDSTAATIMLNNLRASILAQWAATETRKLSVRVDSVSAAGDSAIVTTTLHWDRIVGGIGMARKDTIVSNVTNREVWRNTPKGWRSIRKLSGVGTNLVNGKLEQVRQ